jgi:hypothetical protein
MPYPVSCPECGGAFRNTGTHFTARRNEVGRHVLLELGCQNTRRRYWWDFTSGSLTEDGRIGPTPPASIAASNGSLHLTTNGHSAVSTLERPAVRAEVEHEDRSALEATAREMEQDVSSVAPAAGGEVARDEREADAAQAQAGELTAALPIALPGQPPAVAPSLKEAFVRQLQLDRLTLRQMRSWLMSDEARRAIEVAAGATEATYERLSLILFGADLPQLLGKQAAVPANSGMSAEERLELQREKARIRARVRRAAAKAARQN